MSIKSQTPGVASDRPLMSRDRGPNYISKNKNYQIENTSINNLSTYIKRNLKNVKPRGSEHR